MARKKTYNTRVAELINKLRDASEGYTVDVVLKAATSLCNVVLYESESSLPKRLAALKVLFETAQTDAVSFDQFMNDNRNMN